MEPKPSRGSEAQAPLTRRTHPVFVDQTGRRVGRVRTAAIAGVASVGLLLGVAAVSVVAVPTVVSPLLPAPAPVEPDGAATSDHPAAPPDGAAPDPAPPAADEGQPEPSTEAGAGTTTPVGFPAADPAPAPAPAPSPTSEAAAPGNAPPTDDRGASASAPGRSHAPTEPAKP